MTTLDEPEYLDPEPPDPDRWLCKECRPGWLAYSVADPSASPEPVDPPHHVGWLHGPDCGHDEPCDLEFADCECEGCAAETELIWPGWRPS